jgi:tRNA A37 N6-isopentenylltransferase MiaA
MSREETEEEMVRVNMRYAHRQMSWWKGRKEIEWFGSLKEALFQVQL